MAPRLWQVALVGAFMVVASGSEVGGSTDQPLGLADDDACAAGHEAECSLSLRLLRARQHEAVEVSKEGGLAAQSIEGAEALDVETHAGGQDAVKEAADAADVAFEGSAERGHHHVEKQLRWAGDRKYCMSVDSNVFGNGQKMQIWECKTGMGQFFDYTPTEPTTLLRSAAAPAFCIVIDGNHNDNGAKVQLWQCDSGSQAQRWIVQTYDGLMWDGQPGVFLKNAAFPSKCLVVNGNHGYNGNKLQIWDCQGSEQFKLWLPTR